MSLTPRQIEASYTACRRVARRSGSSFYPCFFVLRRPKRRAMEALYAFMRHSDDLGDSPRPNGCRHKALVRWRAQMERALHGQLDPADALADGAILPALAETVRRFQIPESYLHDVIDGVQMDLENRRYESFEELAVYCRRVASAVGLACIHVWGFSDDAALEPARACGIALQLTNILRDLREDSQRGRIYLPLADLTACQYPPEDLLRGVADARFDRLMDLEIGRAERLYHEGAELLDYLAPDGRRICGMMISTYHRLLGRIKRRPREVLLRRVCLGRWAKLRIAARWTLLPPRRSALP